MHLGNQSASLDDETEYLFLGPNTQIHEDNDAVSDANNFPCFTHNELLVSGPVATKVWSRSFVWSTLFASGSVLPIPETSENTYYDYDETTERANDEDIRQYYYELGRANSHLSEGVIKLQ